MPYFRKVACRIRIKITTCHELGALRLRIADRSVDIVPLHSTRVEYREELTLIVRIINERVEVFQMRRRETALHFHLAAQPCLNAGKKFEQPVCMVNRNIRRKPTILAYQ